MFTPNLDPAYLQRNIDTLCAIGGLYDWIALEVERMHHGILAEWRLDNPAKSAIDWLTEYGRPVPTQYTQIGAQHAENDT